MRLSIIFILFSVLLSASHASDVAVPKLKFPLDCELGQTCWIARYVNHASDEGRKDYTCGDRSQIGHKGTDIMLADIGEMQRGVNVLAATNGVVKFLRDGVPNEFATQENRKEKSKIGLGNVIGIEHSSGFITLYAHMMPNSLTVKKGQTVKAGQILGKVGLSGLTEYPHMHFGLMKDNVVYDPFNSKKMAEACDIQKTESAWEDTPFYKSMTLLPPFFTSKPINRQSQWQAPPNTLPANSRTLFLNGRTFGAQAGDRWLMKIIRPDGMIASERTSTLDKSQQSYRRYSGIRRPEGGFMPGIWEGKILVIRQAKNGTITKFEKTAQIEVVAPH